MIIDENYIHLQKQSSILEYLIQHGGGIPYKPCRQI